MIIQVPEPSLLLIALIFDRNVLQGLLIYAQVAFFGFEHNARNRICTIFSFAPCNATQGTQGLNLRFVENFIRFFIAICVVHSLSSHGFSACFSEYFLVDAQLMVWLLVYLCMVCLFEKIFFYLRDFLFWGGNFFYE